MEVGDGPVSTGTDTDQIQETSKLKFVMMMIIFKIYLSPVYDSVCVRASVSENPCKAKEAT